MLLYRQYKLVAKSHLGTLQKHMALRLDFWVGLLHQNPLWKYVNRSGTMSIFSMRADICVCLRAEQSEPFSVFCVSLLHGYGSLALLDLVC